MSDLEALDLDAHRLDLGDAINYQLVNDPAAARKILAAIWPIIQRRESLLVSERLGSGVTREDGKGAANENELRARIEALHYPVVEGWSDWCWSCTTQWPCATFRALGVAP